MDVEGCLFMAARRLLAAWGFLQLQPAGSDLSSQPMGFSLRQLVLWNTGSRSVGFSSCDAHTLSCSTACGIFPDQGSNPPPALAGRFLASELLSLLQNCYSPLRSLDQCFSTLESHDISRGPSDNINAWAPLPRKSDLFFLGPRIFFKLRVTWSPNSETLVQTLL